MVRELKIITENGDGIGGIGGACLLFWAALLTLSLISAIIFSCADGVSKDKSSSGDTNFYGGGCAADCGGAGCGAACGG
ncbi:uncharacterized protein LOC110422733 [Herrania umbratica]|uniref:Uncharacterized protein LOC110422733 n=1 Tax=Herrania umbratica TaxID=108875 RepID=A0A6J1AZ21_9ROSI|nr:uncharacterized protein LOC110422733 [Herrania umbratica]